MYCLTSFIHVVFSNDPATTDIYTYLHTLSLLDALPICLCWSTRRAFSHPAAGSTGRWWPPPGKARRTPMSSHLSSMPRRSEEHTSELQSLMRISYAVICLKKKKQKSKIKHYTNTQ